jgi:hypothetical protein
MPPSSRERFAARIRNREALADRRKTLPQPPRTNAALPGAGPDALRAAYEQGRVDAVAELAAKRDTAREAADAAKAYAKENQTRRALARTVRASVEKPLPRVVEATILVKAISTAVLIAELKRRGVL